jgi:threonine dehydrogenase-like Zn-dependent dehydrogenase
MSDVLDKYKSLECTLPKTNLAWRMKEAGVENFGKDGVDTLPLLKPKDDEVLLRVDAIGICFSDVKLITQGSTHPRITGRDLVGDPVTPGHEVSLTVIEAGAQWKDTYKPGSRYIVQADVYFKGVNIAYGYALAGGMQQFGIVGEPVLNGDEGSYLIPVQPDTGYAEAALVEPWTCVVASYRIAPRKCLKPGGVTLIVGCEDGDYNISGAICSAGAPGKIILAGLSDKLKSGICGCGGCNAEIVEAGSFDKLRMPIASAVTALAQERTGAQGFDDVIVLGTPDPELVEALGANLAKHAVMAIVADKPISRPVKIDVGRVHYDYIDYVGTKSRNVADAYASSRVSELKPGGTAWFLGAAGAMGSMHVQRAAKMANGPKKMLCTDVDNYRMECLKASIADSVRDNGIEVIYLNPVEHGQEAVNKAIAQITGGKGFDDIVVLVPVPALIESAIPHLAQSGLMNIFAGVPRGTVATLDLSATYMKGNRFVGSSGSRPQDMIDTLGFTESGDLPTRNSLAAIGGINAMAEGVHAVKEARFPGKTVIFPHIEMPLTALTDLDKVMPNVFAKLKDGKFWTKEAEEELLRSTLEI